MGTTANRVQLFPATQEREYQRALVAYHTTYVNETKARLKYLDMRLDGFNEDFTAIMAGLLLFAESLSAPLIFSLPDRFMAVSTWQGKQWVLQVKAATGIDLNQPNIPAFRAKFGLGVDVFRAEPWLIPLRDNWVASNVSLIKDMPQKYLTQVEAVVRSGVAQGLGVRGISQQLEQIEGIDKRRAKLIASDQIGKANAALTQHRQMDLGIDSYVWRSSNDSRVRPTHAEANGQVFKWAKPPSFTGGHPGNAVRCLPYESNIEVAHACNKLWRRTNAAKSAFIVTESGKSVEATLNHPVLTNRGWLAIQDINVGDYVFRTSNQSFHGMRNDVQNSPAKIGEIFDTIAGYVGFNTSRTANAELEFNGDAVDSEVDTIDISGFLPNEVDAKSLEVFGELFFTFADSNIGDAVFSIDSSLYLAASRLWFSTDSIVRGACKLLSLINGKSGHPDDVCLTAISWFNASFDQSRPDGCPSSAVLFGNGLLTHSSGIIRNNRLNGVILAIMCRLAELRNNVANSAQSLGEIVAINPKLKSDRLQTGFPGSCIEKADRVTEKFIGEFTRAHVYNLGTLNEWYSSDSLIIHNCRCTASPVFPD